MTKFLVIRFSSIGDIVLTSPVVRHLKNQVFDGAEVHYLTKKQYEGILINNPNIDKIYTIENSTAEIREQLANEEYHYILDLHVNIRSRMVKRHTKVLSFDLNKLNWQKWLWVNFGVNRMQDRHIVDRYLETISSFGIINDGKGLDYFIPEEANKKSKDFLEEYGLNEYYVLVLGAVHPGKRFSEGKVIDILSKQNKPVVLIGGQQESDFGNILAKKFDHVINVCGATTIDESAAIMNFSKFVVSPDTGMMHIAAALGKDIISYWGCTHPGLGMSPYFPGEKSVIIQPKNRNKRPCSKLGNRCKYGSKNRCPDAIEDQVIIDAMNNLW